jgi:hypothetical protein
MWQLNLMIVALCWLAATLSMMGGRQPAALAYAGFGVGYLGLTWLDLS